MNGAWSCSICGITHFTMMECSPAKDYKCVRCSNKSKTFEGLKCDESFIVIRRQNLMSGSEIKCVICHDSPQDKQGAWTDGRSFICPNCRKHINVDWGKPEGDISVTGDYAATEIAPSFPRKPESLTPLSLLDLGDKTAFEFALNILAEGFKQDSTVKASWKAQLVMCYYDSYKSVCKIDNDAERLIVMKVAEGAADRFLDLFIGGKEGLMTKASQSKFRWSGDCSRTKCSYTTETNDYSSLPVDCEHCGERLDIFCTELKEYTDAGGGIYWRGRRVRKDKL